jgi:hypothetical protein
LKEGLGLIEARAEGESEAEVKGEAAKTGAGEEEAATGRGEEEADEGAEAEIAFWVGERAGVGGRQGGKGSGEVRGQSGEAVDEGGEGAAGEGGVEGVDGGLVLNCEAEGGRPGKGFGHCVGGGEGGVSPLPFQVVKEAEEEAEVVGGGNVGEG